ncbi:MAG: hypothetical protein Q9160_007666 [Pyrenula sp. 1 TL-2023]
MASPAVSDQKPVNSQEILQADGISDLHQKLSHESDTDDLDDTFDDYVTVFEDAGTLCKVKVLYEGPRKCHCCINWVEEYPEDVKESIEEQSESKRHAILVRMKKNHGEGKPLVLDSVVVQNLHLKNLLGEVFRDYVGITTNLKKLVFRPPFHEFFYAWDHFSELCKSQSDIVVKNYARLLRKVLSAELAETIFTSADLARNGVITFEYLWTIFKPGIDVYSSQDGHDRIYKLTSTGISMTFSGQRCFSVNVQYVDFDGNAFGWATTSLPIFDFSGTKSVTDLGVFPAVLHPNVEELKRELSTRGKKFKDLQQDPYHYAGYQGLATDVEDNRFNVDGRIIIDPSAYHFFNAKKRAPLMHINLSIPLTSIQVNDDRHHFDDSSSDGDSSSSRHKHRRDSEDPIMVHQPMAPPHPAPGPSGFGSNFTSPPFPPHPQGPPPPGPLPYGSPGFGPPPMMNPGPGMNPGLGPAPPLGFGFGPARPRRSGFPAPPVPRMKLPNPNASRQATFYVDPISEVRWNEDAFESLLLAEDYKKLILAFVQSQVQNKDSFDDVIEGKGRGIIMLLEGTPGVGKTLTAEAVADKLRRPLYAISGGELGTSAQQLESALNTILEIAAKWDAVLLLDECDVFLEKRSMDNLKRNGTVAVFLRLLEYYRGVLFMTTNRVDRIDPAFQSRIHLTIEYPRLTGEVRRQIWARFLEGFCPESRIEASELEELARVEANGREIKNLVKTAQLLAKHESKPLTVEHIRTVLRVIKRNAITGE